ncbi:MAG: hypothetical protein F4Z04_02925 [Acidobacteria bacterium]|nr:hypothetical protein [Acidobacteriota bacterium]
MAEFNIRSDAIDVEQIMAQIRSRIREKRGVDYTEEEIRELAGVKLERFLDPKNVRSDLLEHYRQKSGAPADAEPWPLPDEFDPASVYRSARPGLVGRALFGIRRLLNPILKLFFNPAPLLDSVSVQSRDLRRTSNILQRHAEDLTRRTEMDVLTYEVMNNLVVEMTRLAIEMKNHKMRVESVAARLDFDERRARALEETLQQQARSETSGGSSEGSGERRRRRRRRGRRASGNGNGNDGGAEAAAPTASQPEPEPAPTAAREASDAESGPVPESSDPDPES